MRKLFLAFLLITSFGSLMAQKTSDVKEKIEKGKYDEAKEKIDKILAEPKNQSNSEAWFLKSQVYYNLGKSLNDTAMTAQGLDAMKTYLKLEETAPENKKFLVSTIEGNKTVFNIRDHYFMAGAEAFNSRNYEKALYNFQYAIDAFNLLSKYKFTTVPFDTSAVLYAGISAETLKNRDLAVSFYQQLAERKVTDTSLSGIYEYVISYYLSKDDLTNARKYLALGSEVFPQNPVWIAYELDMVGDDKDAKIAKYEELLAKNPNNYELAMDYGIQLLNHTYYNETKPADYLQRQAKLQKALDDVIKLNPTPLAHYIMSRHLGNQLADLEEEHRNIKGSGAAQVAQRKELAAKISAKNDELFQYSLKTHDLYSKETDLKPNEKIYLKEVTNNIIYYYQAKKQNDKAAQYQAKLKTM